MEAVLQNLIKIIQVCGTRRVYIMTPVPRFLTAPYCSNKEHCRHLVETGAGIRITCDLHRLSAYIKNQLRDLPNATGLNTGDILAGKTNAAPSDVLTATADWGPVHGPDFAYDLIAAYLLERIRCSTRAKRPREDSSWIPSSDTQRSRGYSFSDGVNNRSRTAPGSAPRFRDQLISYPVNPRYGGQLN